MADKKSEKDIQNDHRHLYRLHELKDYKVASDDPDVRGWEILDRDNEKFGTIKELIVDPQKKKVRYLDVEPSSDLSGAGNERLLIPIGVARLDKDHKNVVVDLVDKDALASYPLYRGDTVTREYEIDVVERFNRPDSTRTDRTATTTRETGDFYDTNVYDEDRFYTNRSGKRNL